MSKRARIKAAAIAGLCLLQAVSVPASAGAQAQKRALRDAREAFAGSDLETAVDLYEGLLATGEVREDWRQEALYRSALGRLASDPALRDVVKARAHLDRARPGYPTGAPRGEFEAILSLLDELAAVRTEASAGLEAARDECAVRVAAKEEQLAAHEREAAGLRGEAERLAATLSAQNALLDDLGRSLAAREHELERREGVTDFLSDQLEETREHEQQMLQVVIAKNEELEARSRQLAAMRRQLDEKEADLAQKEDELEKREEAIRKALETVAGGEDPGGGKR